MNFNINMPRCNILDIFIHIFLEKAMAPHSSTLAWNIPWMEEPGRLQSMGSLRVRHDWELRFHFSLSCIGEGDGNPLQCSCLENSRDGGAWWAAIYGVSQSWTRLKRLNINIGDLEKTLILGKSEGRGEWDNRGGDGWMASLIQWTWVWATSRSWWRTGKPGVL